MCKVTKPWPIFSTDSWKSAKRHAVGAKGRASNWTRVDVLHPWTEYEFRISASNSVGTSGWSSPTLKVSTDQEAPEGPPTDISVKANSSQSLDISWKVQLKSHQILLLAWKILSNPCYLRVVLENAGIAKGIFRQEIGFIYFSVKDDVFTFPLKRHVLSSIRKHKSLRGSILDTF